MEVAIAAAMLHPCPNDASWGQSGGDSVVAALKLEMIAKLSITLSIPWQPIWLNAKSIPFMGGFLPWM